MRLGISTASFFNKVPLEQCFDVLRQMHVDVTEVFLSTYSEYEKPFVDMLAEKKGSITVHSIHSLTTQFEPQLFSNNAKTRTDAENIFRKLLYAGFALGAKYYTFHGPTRLKKQEYKFDYEKLGMRMNQLIDMANSYGMQISYENVHWTYNSFPEYFTNLKKYSPKLYGTLDIKQAMQSDIDYSKFLNTMKDSISTVHLCEVINGITALPGAGKFNYEKLFDKLEKFNPNANVLIEAYSLDYNEIGELQSSYDYINEIFKKSQTK